MNRQIIKKINILKNRGIDLLNIKQVKNTALDMKMYDLVVYINNNFTDYIEHVKKLR